MRRAVALIVVGAGVAVAAGLAIPANAVKVNVSSITASQFNDELVAIDHSPSYNCYLDASVFVSSQGRSGAPALKGASANAWANSAAVNWARVRTSQLAPIQFVRVRDPYAYSPAALARARTALAQEIDTKVAAAFQMSTQAAPFSCPAATSGATTLASLPSWFVNDQVDAEAAAIGLLSIVRDLAPERGVALKAWFNQHQGAFQTTCVRLIVLPDAATADKVANEIANGLSLAEAARRYSIDPSKNKAGAIGCFSPTSSGFVTVQQDLGQLAIGKVVLIPATPTERYPYLLGPSKREPSHLRFAQIASVVAQIAHDHNLQAVQSLDVQIQRAAGVDVDPAVGTWVPTTVTGVIVPPATPLNSTVTNPAANTAPAPSL